jgi:hypothetical protein
MSCARVLGIAACAVFFSAVLGVAAANAEKPVYYECAKQVGGEFEKGCEKTGGTGGFAPVPGNGKGKAFKGTSKAGSKITWYFPSLKSEWGCSTAKYEGHVSEDGSRDEGIVITFAKCGFLGKNCTSAGAAHHGEIITAALAGELGYINKPGAAVGVALSAESGGDFADFECEGLFFEVRGSLIGQLQRGINSFDKEQILAFSVNAGTHRQAVRKFESDPTEHFLESSENSGTFSEASVEWEGIQKGEDLDLKA